MSWKDILVIVSEAEADEPALALGEALANQCPDCNLAAAFLTPLPDEPLAYEPTVVAGVWAELLGRARQEAEAERRKVEARLRRSSKDIDLRNAEALSRDLGLPTWDKPSFACLSSRFQYGDAITADKLRQVDRAEAALRELGFRQFRVRHHDRLARLELGADDLARVLDPERRAQVVERLRQAGYLYVTLDLQGFRSGSANEALRWIARR